MSASNIPTCPQFSYVLLRERVIHLLAPRPYGRAELLFRLSRNGLSTDRKDQLDHILTKVGRVARGSAVALAPSVIPDLDPHWPGHSASEKNRITSLKMTTFFGR
ncbi:hypothetical protein AHF37_08126 [Paragonimus kellicotti]|nr:hypothetical protein AHF37_08126 [Paragonimus kellicotti]